MSATAYAKTAYWDPYKFSDEQAAAFKVQLLAGADPWELAAIFPSQVRVYQAFCLLLKGTIYEQKDVALH